MPKHSRRTRVHKGGRPRKSPQPTIDLGTPELAAKRAALADDPTLSTCPLDLALSKGLIDRDTHTAAGYFAACRALVFGSPHPRALDLLRTSGADTIPDTTEAEARYRAACVALRQRGMGIFGAVESFVVHERMPLWMFTHASHPHRTRTLDGLHALVDWYRGRRRAA